MEKRRASGWQALGSYTFSRTSGLQASSGVSAADAQVSTIAPNGTFGRDPNNLTNAYGRLPNDRPHMFRAMGTVDVPHTGVMLSANVHPFSGKPWAATTQVTLNQGSQRILLEPRGSRRLEPQTILDLRVSRPIRTGPSAGSIDCRRAERAEQHGGRSDRQRQQVQPDVRAADRVRRSAPGDVSVRFNIGR